MYNKSMWGITMYTKKAVPFLLLKVLEKYSDDNHQLTQSDIINYMKNDYGLDVERKSISANIKLLEELDYDIIKNGKGVSLGDRVFNQNQTRYLIDAVYSSKNINGSTASDIIKRFASRESIYDKRNYEQIYKTTNEVNRAQSPYIFHVIDVINDAMRQKKRIEFNLITYDDQGRKIFRNDGYNYKVSPYYLVNNFGNYYLLGYYRSKYGPFNVFKLDRMANVCVSEWDEKPKDEAGLPANFKISEYLNEHIYIYGGDTVEAELELKSPDEIINIKDWFNNGAKIETVNGLIHAKVKCNEQALIYWLMQYGKGIKVISPTSLKEKVINLLKEMLNNYEE